MVLLISGIFIVLSKRDSIVKNWSNKDVRCNPLIMITAPLYGKDFKETTSECLTDYFKNELQGELSNIKDKIKGMNELHTNTNNTMNKMNYDHMSTKNLGDFDMKTFEIEARPVNEIKDLRAGMSLLINMSQF